MVCLRHSFFVADKSNHSTLYAANFGSWDIIFVFAHTSKDVDKTDNNFDIADNNDNFGSWYFIFVLEQWSLLSNTSIFLMFAAVNKIDNDFDTADNDNGNDEENKSVDNQDDSLEGVETN